MAPSAYRGSLRLGVTSDTSPIALACVRQGVEHNPGNRAGFLAVQMTDITLAHLASVMAFRAINHHMCVVRKLHIAELTLIDHFRWGRCLRVGVWRCRRIYVENIRHCRGFCFTLMTRHTIDADVVLTFDGRVDVARHFDHLQRFFMLRLVALFRRRHVVTKVTILSECQIVITHQQEHLVRGHTLEDLKVFEGLILAALRAPGYKITDQHKNRQSQRAFF